MRQKGIEPNVITYSALIRACAKGEQPQKAQELLQEMRQRGLEPDMITYSALTSACAKSNACEKASRRRRRV